MTHKDNCGCVMCYDEGIGAIAKVVPIVMSIERQKRADAYRKEMSK